MDKKPKPEGVQFPTEKLLGCKEFSKYNTAFLRALLPEKAYTKKKAVEIVEQYFNKGGKK